MARYRDKRLTIWLTEDELNTIRTRKELADTKNTADYIMTCVCDTPINVIDTKPLMALKTELSRIGTNINQIAKVANTSKSIHGSDIAALKNYVDEVRTIISNTFDFCVKER